MPDEKQQTLQDGKKLLRQSRIKYYFVCAAKKIIDSEGIEAVTTRRVSEMAGYNSGTLYNYFDDLDHVIFLACMDYLEQYNEVVSKRVQGLTNPLELYLTTVECFGEYSHRHPKIFWQLFYGCPETRRKDYVAEYYNLFHAGEVQSYETLTKAKLVHNMSQRNLIFLSGCIESGYLTTKNAEMFSELSLMITRYLLEEVINKNLTADEAQEKTMLYFRHTLKSYLEPQYQGLLAE